MKTKGSIKFKIAEIIARGEFSAKDLIEILEFIKLKDKTKDETIND